VKRYVPALSAPTSFFVYESSYNAPGSTLRSCRKFLGLLMHDAQIVRTSSNGRRE